jgi:hypothetical protein
MNTVSGETIIQQHLFRLYPGLNKTPHSFVVHPICSHFERAEPFFKIDLDFNV